MQALDDVSIFFGDEFAEEVLVDGLLVRGIYSISDEVVLDEVVVEAPTLRVPASVIAAIGNTCRIRGNAFRVRQVLDMPPDGAIRRLVLARVG
jgi:hypothetical protein